MKKNEEDEPQKGSSVSKNVGGKMPTICERRIWKFYEWAVILAPIAIMLSHWYIFYVFSQNSHELMHYSDENEPCIAWIYCVLYLYIPLMILPATYFFKWCNLWRIPFVYFIFINVERWYYDSWFCTNEMVDTHYILIYCICAIYLFELAGIFLSSIDDIMNYFRGIKRNISIRIRWQRRKDRMRNDEQIEQIARWMEEDRQKKGECCL